MTRRRRRAQTRGHGPQREQWQLSCFFSVVAAWVSKRQSWVGFERASQKRFQSCCGCSLGLFFCLVHQAGCKMAMMHDLTTERPAGWLVDLVDTNAYVTDPPKGSQVNFIPRCDPELSHPDFLLDHPQFNTQNGLGG